MSELKRGSPVTEVPAADSSMALAHFERLLAYETDCWDVHASLSSHEPGFVLVDVRSPERFREGHLPGAVNLPHGRLTERNLASYAPETLSCRLLLRTTLQRRRQGGGSALHDWVRTREEDDRRDYRAERRRFRPGRVRSRSFNIRLKADRASDTLGGRTGVHHLAKGRSELGIQAFLAIASDAGTGASCCWPIAWLPVFRAT